MATSDSALNSSLNSANSAGGSDSPSDCAAGSAGGSDAYPVLLSPLTVGSLQLRNRVVMGSMHTGMEDDFSEFGDLEEFYAERARGGVGLIVTGGFSPTLEGRLTPFNCTVACADMTDDEFVENHSRVTARVHEGGARIFLQLLHAGRYSYHTEPVSADWSASPITPFEARALTTEEAWETIRAYARAARLAHEAGYDGVQVMGSEGYLINQFLASRTNHREDEFGGSAHARQRFPVEVVRAIRAEMGSDFPIDYRISVLDLVEGGQSWDEVKELASRLVEAGVDMFTTGIGWHEARIPTIVTSVPRAGFAWASARLQQHVDVPVVVSNRINTPEVAESLLDGSWTDSVGTPDDVTVSAGSPAGSLVSMARPLLADSQFVNLAAAGRADEIVTCIGCNQACLDHTFSMQRSTCLLNPRAGFEREIPLTPVDSPKRIAVIGGGMAGLFFAEAAARRGHRVEVFEAGEAPGGQFRLAMNIPGKEEFRAALSGVVHRLDRLGVVIHCGRFVSVDDVRGEFDQVVVASGVQPRVPEIEGVEKFRWSGAGTGKSGGTADGANTDSTAEGSSMNSAARGESAASSGPVVVTYDELVSGSVSAGRRVAVIGAGGIGFDVSEFLAARDDAPRPQPVASWSAEWGVGSEGLTGSHEFDGSGREIHMLQRKPSKQGKGLGTTTGWVHRAAVAMAGVAQWSGVTYNRIDEEGLHITVDRSSLPRRALGATIVGEEATTLKVCIPVDTVVLCTGQESVRDGVYEADESPAGSDQSFAPKSSGATEFVDSAGFSVSVIGGAYKAAELDAKTAIDQAVRLANSI